jgi:triacylglycerol esterase/lipase EstA (alpha/beta hydrolase family)
MPRRPSVFGKVRRVLAGNIGELRYYVGKTPARRRDDWSHDGETVLLIQGFLQTRQVMDTLEARLRADGYRVLSFHLGGLLDNFNTRGVPTLARMIDGKLRKLREREDMGPIHIIGHSKGGVVARWLVQKEGGAEYTRTVVTLGSPHHGTPTAAIGGALGLVFVSRSIWQMFPWSPTVKDLNRAAFPAGVRLVSVYSGADFVCPWRYSVLTAQDGADVRNVMVRGLGHMDLVEDPYVYGLVLRELQERPSDPASGPLAESDEERSARG